MLVHRNGFDEAILSFTFNHIKGKNVIELAMVLVVYGLSNTFVRFTINISISNIDQVIEGFKLTKIKIDIFYTNKLF